MSQHPREADTLELLRVLVAGGVEFIVVGGTAAQLHGSTLATLDLDIVRRRTPDNVDALLRVLVDLDAHQRYDLADRRLRPTAAHLLGSGQVNLSTRLGPLDPLCELAPGQGYDELLPHSEEMEDEGLRIRVLDLPTLIAVESRVGRARDKLAVAELLVVQRERENDESRVE